MILRLYYYAHINVSLNKNMNVKIKFGIFTLNFRSPKIESKYSHSVEVMEKSSIADKVMCGEQLNNPSYYVSVDASGFGRLFYFRINRHLFITK
jgi:hypothetical protein